MKIYLTPTLSLAIYKSKSGLFITKTSNLLEDRMAMDKTSVPTVPRSGYDLPHQCLIERNKKTSTYILYLDLKGDVMAKGKFLLAARKHRNGLHSEYIISDDVSQGSNGYVGKLRSDFFGTKYTIDDRYNIAKQSNKQISPEVPAGSSEVGRVAYKLNLAKKRGPRKMVCSLNMNETLLHDSKTEFMNKVPRWHEALKCWCLNFHGRVTRASVKNFQVVAVDKDGDEKVLLQFGRVGADTFTMDYGEPFSVFQAFAICLTTFGPKFGCE